MNPEIHPGASEWQDVVASWNWEGFEGKKIGIEIYSSYPEVELFLNNVSLGRKKTTVQMNGKSTWMSAISHGVLKAKGYDENGVTETCDLIPAENLHSFALHLTGIQYLLMVRILVISQLSFWTRMEPEIQQMKNQ